MEDVYVVLGTLAIIAILFGLWYLTIKITQITTEIGCGILYIIGAGALELWLRAYKQGFLGIIAYTAAWVFMLPAMVILCGIFGVIVLTEVYDENKSDLTLSEEEELNCNIELTDRVVNKN